MLFRPPSTSRVEIWWVICSESSLSSLLLITPFDILISLLSSCLASFSPTNCFSLFALSLSFSSCNLILYFSSLSLQLHPPHCFVTSTTPPLLFYHFTFIFHFVPSSMSQPSSLFSLNPLHVPHLSFHLHLHGLFASSYLFIFPVTFNFPFYHLHCAFCTLSSLSPQVQCIADVVIGGFFSVVKLICGGLLFWFMARFTLDRECLTTVARLFTVMSTLVFAVQCRSCECHGSGVDLKDANALGLFKT